MMNQPANADPEKFQDPLQDYEPKSYADRLEQALAEETVAAIKHEPFVSISPDTTIREAVAKLASMHVACLLVEENGELVGVFSDRDVLDKVTLEFDELQDKCVRDVMTPNPVYVYESDSAAAALCVMAVSGHRHVPVLSMDNRPAGIVSPQRVTGFLHRYFGDD
jgi:CBS domain-containing protein